ncbi:hypothetical protein [Caldiplasma sukawensis]
MFEIFNYEKKYEKNVDEFINTDPVFRLGITKKDGVTFGLEGNIIIFQGSDEEITKILSKPPDYLKPVDTKKAAEIIEKINRENEEAASGLGSIFG